MKKILLVGYYMPPDGGSVFHRLAMFARYLPQFDYKAHILTSMQAKLHFKSRDLRDLTDSIYTVQDKALLLPHWMQPYLKRLFIPDKQTQWNKSVLKQVIKLHELHQYDLVMVCTPPFSSHLLAAQIKKTLQIPVVVDFAEVWSFEPLFYALRKQPKHLESQKKALAAVDYIITSTHTAEAAVRTLVKKVSTGVVMNSYDPNLAQYVDIEVEGKKRMNFSLIGHLDRYHSPVTFFKVMHSIILTGELHKEHFDINIYGNNVASEWELMFLHLGSRMNFQYYDSYDKYLEKAAEADILVLLCTNMPDSVELSSVLFDYIMLQKPILAVVDKENELTALLNAYGNAHLIYLKDLDNGKKTVLNLYNKWKQGTLNKPVAKEFVNSYNCFARIRELATIFSLVLERKMSSSKQTNVKASKEISQAS